MFKSLRFRLTVLFAILTSIVYILLSGIGFFYFHSKLDNALNHELQILLSEISPGIDLNTPKLRVSKWELAALNEPFERSATIQLFDTNRVLVAQYGVPGGPTLYDERHELIDRGHHMLSESRKLYDGERFCGYLQIQVPAAARDRATRHFIIMLSWMAPLLLVALGFVGYIFAGRAVAPIEQSFDVLKRFLLYAGHELATPVSIIQVNSEALEEELLEQSIITKQLPVIHRATERMDKIIKALSLLAKMESPEFRIKKDEFRFDKLVRHTVLEFEELYKEKNVTLHVSHLEQIRFLGDVVFLKLLLSNLLNNALRYCDPGSSVSVSLSARERRVILSVADTGVGIATDQLPFIFDRFYRGDTGRAHPESGSGLGLAIVKSIVEQHGGEISVESTPGKGSTFTAILPVSTPLPAFAAVSKSTS